MRTIAKLGLAFALGWGSFVFADTVVKTQPKRKLIAVTFSSEKSFKPDEEVCLMSGEVSVACGNILQSSEKGAIIFLRFGGGLINPGAQVETTSRRALPRSRGLMAGLNYKFFYIQFQQLFAENLTYGVLTEAIILRNGDSMKGFATLMTINYYSQGLLKGLWLMGAAGIHIVNREDSAAQRSSVTSLLTQANIGWRFRAGTFTLGMAVGGQYFLDKSLHAITGRNGLVPSAMLDIGFIF